MDYDESLFYGIISLYGENYRNWHGYVLNILREVDALEYITQKVIRPSGELSPEQRHFHDTWEWTDARIRWELISVVDGSIRHEFEQHKTSKELWDALYERYGVYTKIPPSAPFGFWNLNPEPVYVGGVKIKVEKPDSREIHLSLPASWHHVEEQNAYLGVLNTCKDLGVNPNPGDETLPTYGYESEDRKGLRQTQSKEGKRGTKRKREGADPEVRRHPEQREIQAPQPRNVEPHKRTVAPKPKPRKGKTVARTIWLDFANNRMIPEGQEIFPGMTNSWTHF